MIKENTQKFADYAEKHRTRLPTVYQRIISHIRLKVYEGSADLYDEKIIEAIATKIMTGKER